MKTKRQKLNFTLDFESTREYRNLTARELKRTTRNWSTVTLKSKFWCIFVMLDCRETPCFEGAYSCSEVWKMVATSIHFKKNCCKLVSASWVSYPVKRKFGKPVV